ncbi:fusaric acid resistance family protein [Alicyclobacillus sacchari]|uniref:Fusaric acid resistance family protein n=1 Tax=Alicyclobacillus sacchari TaxID=392010 RepID=A0A4R8LPB9_9BACL|nr:FUSC family protein [Alicyclobacillus sacchari]TDY46263.1 fusaric acid resistance family protein [Alicyclobacillus sacchari]
MNKPKRYPKLPVRLDQPTTTEALTHDSPKLHHAFLVRKAPWPWRRAIGAGLCLFVPLLTATLAHRPLWGLLATIGGFTGIYTAAIPLRRLALKLAIVALGLSISLGLGTVSAGSPGTIAIVFAFVGGCATFLCGSLQVAPPGPFFFIMACAIGTGMPVEPTLAPERMGIALIGGTIAWIISMAIAWGLSLRQPHHQTEPAKHLMRRAPVQIAAARLRLAIHVRSPYMMAGIRMAVGICCAVLFAYALGNTRPYWVPIGCAATLIGTTVMGTIHRAMQRALGTTLGVFIAGAILSIHPSYIVLACIVFALQTVTELLIPRNYGLAVIFITPLALTITEIARVGMSVPALIHARFIDTLVGCGIGLVIRLLWWLPEK